VWRHNSHTIFGGFAQDVVVNSCSQVIHIYDITTSSQLAQIFAIGDPSFLTIQTIANALETFSPSLCFGAARRLNRIRVWFAGLA
jgi:hypothetical protein